MKTWMNEGLCDRLIRFLIAEIALILGYFWLPAPWTVVFYLLGGIALATSLAGFCPLYLLFRSDTSKRGRKPTKKLMVGFTA